MTISSDPLAVHGVRIQDATFLSTGGSKVVRRVTFYVGTHGPFVQDFPSGPESTQAMQNYIRQTVSDLRTVTSATY